MKKLSIYAIALLATGVAQAATLVINGGFESGTVDNKPTGWTAGVTGNAADPFVRTGLNNGVTQVEGSNHLQFRSDQVSPTGGALSSRRSQRLLSRHTTWTSHLRRKQPLII